MVPAKNIILWKVFARLPQSKADAVDIVKELHPDAIVLVHPNDLRR